MKQDIIRALAMRHNGELAAARALALELLQRLADETVKLWDMGRDAYRLDAMKQKCWLIVESCTETKHPPFFYMHADTGGRLHILADGITRRSRDPAADIADYQDKGYTLVRARRSPPFHVRPCILVPYMPPATSNNDARAKLRAMMKLHNPPKP